MRSSAGPRRWRAIDRVIALEPANADAWLRRGQILQWLQRQDQALGAYRQSTMLDPSSTTAWTCQGILLKDLDRYDDAAKCFRQALDRGGDAELNNYLLASVLGDELPAAAPRSYVQQLFDGYASEFEQHLVGVLQYHGHESLGRAAEGAGAPALSSRARSRMRHRPLRQADRRPVRRDHRRRPVAGNARPRCRGSVSIAG
jgi:predicted TPR repeat methyltransferase